MAFKLKGMGFGKGTGYKSPQMMKKESAMKMAKKSAMKKDSLTGKIEQGNMEAVSERATIKNFNKVKGDLVPKSRATNRKPQTETRKNINTDITPQTQLGKKFNKMKGVVMKGKQSAMKKTEDKNKKPNKKLTWSEAVAYDEEMGATGENALTYGMEEGSKPGTFRVKDGFEKNEAGKVVKSPNTMKKGSAMKKKPGNKKIFRKRKLTHGLEGTIKQVRNPITGNVRTTRKLKNPLTGKTRKTVVTSKRGVKKDFEK